MVLYSKALTKRPGDARTSRAVAPKGGLSMRAQGNSRRKKDGARRRSPTADSTLAGQIELRLGQYDDVCVVAPTVHPSKLVSAGVPPAYSTKLGAMYATDALAAMESMPDGSVNLGLTSPPYALEFKKEYGNASKDAYVEWLRPFADQMFRILADDGSFVLNIGGSYEKGTPTRSLYQFRVLLMLCDEVGFHLAQECFWFNPAKLPAPAEWVNVRRVRVKDSVEYVFWLSKSPFPKADNRNVLVEYSPDMVRLLERGYRAKERPSGHNITHKFRTDHGGAIPANLIEAGNNDSNGMYMSRCKEAGVKPHPARFPAAVPDFFIRLLTDPGETVLDPFAGSNTTGRVAEDLGRAWVGFDLEDGYVAASRFRFESHELVGTRRGRGRTLRAAAGG
jgi:DNA modification methylase